MSLWLPFHTTAWAWAYQVGSRKAFLVRREKILQKPKTDASKGRAFNQSNPSGSCQKEGDRAEKSLLKTAE